jgi:hypothetical protein
MIYLKTSLSLLTDFANVHRTFDSKPGIGNPWMREHMTGDPSGCLTVVA